MQPFASLPRAVKSFRPTPLRQHPIGCRVRCRASQAISRETQTAQLVSEIQQIVDAGDPAGRRRVFIDDVRPGPFTQYDACWMWHVPMFIHPAAMWHSPTTQVKPNLERIAELSTALGLDKVDPAQNEGMFNGVVTTDFRQVCLHEGLQNHRQHPSAKSALYLSTPEP